MEFIHSSPMFMRCSQNCHEGWKILAQVLIPLMIGIFTTVIALQQHQSNKDNRENDLQIATKLREQQVELDQFRREQEFSLDQARREQDLVIAEDKHLDSIVNVYIRDLSDLFLGQHFNLSRALLDLIIRPMTLTLLRQIDASRKVLILKFLYESRMLRADFEDTRLDLTDADLRGVALGFHAMPYLSLIGASLINSSFTRTDLTLADFQQADLTDARFIDASLEDVSFYRTRLIRVDFTQSKFLRTDLSLADLFQSSITTDQLQLTSSINYARLANGTTVSSENLIRPADRCSVINWQSASKQNLSVNEQCHFLAQANNITLGYNLSLELHHRLIERRQAFFELRFEARLSHPRSLRIDFLYFTGDQLIARGKFSLRIRNDSFLLSRTCSHGP